MITQVSNDSWKSQEVLRYMLPPAPESEVSWGSGPPSWELGHLLVVCGDAGATVSAALGWVPAVCCSSEALSLADSSPPKAGTWLPLGMLPRVPPLSVALRAPCCVGSLLGSCHGTTQCGCSLHICSQLLLMLNFLTHAQRFSQQGCVLSFTSWFDCMCCCYRCPTIWCHCYCIYCRIIVVIFLSFVFF